jgi:aldose sugar dehydrogenase
MRHFWKVACSLAICGAVAACGEGEPPAPSPGPGGDAGTITGRERLGWDQQAESAEELATFRYVLYIDGTRTELASATCGSGTTTFSCSAQLPSMSPGSHTLELATYIQGAPNLESARSAALRVTVAAAQASASPVSTSAIANSRQVATADGVRLAVNPVAEGLEQSTALAVASDGRIFVAERAGRVRVLRDGTLSEPALTIEDLSVGDHRGGVLDLALDPDFDRNRFVFVLDVVAGADGAPAFRLTRFREAGGKLGERATFLADIPASPSAPSGSISFGPDGKLYVALDNADDPANAERPSSYNGKVLRLNANGSTPDDQPASTPVYSDGHRSPRSLGWDADTGALWLADPVRRDAERLQAADAASGRPGRLARTAFRLPMTTGPSAVALYRGGLIDGLRGNLLAGSDAEGSILRVRFDRSLQRILSTERLKVDGLDRVNAIEVGPDGALYVGTDHEVLRMTPVVGR